MTPRYRCPKCGGEASLLWRSPGVWELVCLVCVLEPIREAAE